MDIETGRAHEAHAPEGFPPSFIILYPLTYTCGSKQLTFMPKCNPH